MNIDILELAALGLVLVFYAIIWYLRKKKDWSFTKATFLAVGLGVIVGLAFKIIGHESALAIRHQMKL